MVGDSAVIACSGVVIVKVAVHVPDDIRKLHVDDGLDHWRIVVHPALERRPVSPAYKDSSGGNLAHLLDRCP